MLYSEISLYSEHRISPVCCGLMINNSEMHRYRTTITITQAIRIPIHFDLFYHPGGGGALSFRGGPHLRYVFRGRRGLFLRPPHVRDFVKEGYFFVHRYEVWGSKSPYNPRNIRGSDAESLPE